MNLRFPGLFHETPFSKLPVPPSRRHESFNDQTVTSSFFEGFPVTVREDVVLLVSGIDAGVVTLTARGANGIYQISKSFDLAEWHGVGDLEIIDGAGSADVIRDSDETKAYFEIRLVRLP